MKAVFIGVLAFAGIACTDPSCAQNSTDQNGGIVWDNSQHGAESSSDQMKTLAFSRIILQMPDGQILGYAHDMYCGNGTGFQAITLDRGFRELPLGAYQQSFGAALTRTGYKTVQKSLLFGDATPQEPDLLVGAAITSIEMKACQQFSLGMLAPDTTTRTTYDDYGRLIEIHERTKNKENPNYIVTIGETIEWQIYDPLNKRVVFTATTQGHGKATGVYQNSQLQAMYAAFDEASGALLAMPELHQIAMRSEAEQSTTEQLSEGVASTTPIAAVPLSSQSFQERLKGIQAQVVTVRTARGSGSGFYIADGLLLTNHHVAAKGAAVKIRFLSGKEIAGLSVASNAHRDVALIRTENVDVVGLPLHIQPPEVGSQDYAVGSPEGQAFEGTVSAGIVSALREHDHANWIQSDVAVTHGSSGGPLFDANGNVIGITDRNADDHDNQVNMNLFIPIAEALQSVGVVVQAPVAEKPVTKVSAKKKAS